MTASVEITLREVWEAQVATTRQLIVVNEKLDRIVFMGDDHERRIRNLEARRWPLSVLAIFLPLVAIIISVIAFFGGPPA